MSLLALTAALRRLSAADSDVDRLCEAAEREQCELAAALHDAERLLSTCAAADWRNPLPLQPKPPPHPVAPALTRLERD